MNNTTMTRRWQAAAKQGLCLLLCLLMFVTLLPVKAYAAAKVDRTQALARIAQLQKELEGKYFTTTGNPCKKPGTASHGCTKCTNANVIKASWFKKAVSLIPSTISKCPEGTSMNTQRASTAAQRLPLSPAPDLLPLPPGIFSQKNPATILPTSTLQQLHIIRSY